MSFIPNLFKIFTGTTANDDTGTPAKNAGVGINENMDLINNALESIDTNAEKKANKVTNLDAPNNTSYPTTQAVKIATDAAQVSAQNYGDAQLVSFQAKSEKGQANGYPSLDANAKVPAAQMYAVTDEIIEGEYINATTFNDALGDPVVGGAAKLYQDTTTGNPTSGKQYRWSGTMFSNIASSPGTTDEVPEGGVNKYFTGARVLAAILTGYTVGNNAVLAASDTVLGAFRKLQGQINALITSIGLKLDKGSYNGTATDLEILANYKETPLGAQAKADQAETNAKEYANGLQGASIFVENFADLSAYTLEEDIFYTVRSENTVYLYDEITDLLYATGVSQQDLEDYAEPLRIAPTVDDQIQVFNLDGSERYENIPSGGGTSFKTDLEASNTDATIADADIFGRLKAASSNVLVKFTWANIKSTLKTYFDTVYAPIGSGGGGGGSANTEKSTDVYTIQESELPFETTASAIDDNYIYGGLSDLIRYSESTGQEVIYSIAGNDSWRCMFISRITGNLYFSPDGNFSNTMASADHGLYKYDGTTVTKVIQLSTSENIWGIDEDTNGNIFCGVYTGGTVKNNNIYKSSDGNTFTVIFDPNITGPVGEQNLNRHIHAVHVDRRNNYVYACFGDGISTKLNYRSIDSGVTWTSIIENNPDQQMTAVLAVDGHRLFGVDRTNQGGIWLSYDDVNTIQVLDTHYENVFFLKQSDVTGWIYAGFKLDPSGTTDFRADLYVSKDLGLNWILYDTISSPSSSADGYAYAGDFKNGVCVISYLYSYKYQKGIIIKEIANATPEKSVKNITVSRELTEFDNNKILNISKNVDLIVPLNKLQFNFNCDLDVIFGSTRILKSDGVLLDVPYGRLLPYKKYGKIYKKKNSDEFRLQGDFEAGTVDILSEYKFEGNANDSVDTNNGVATDVTYVAGVIGLAASFNGTTSQIVVDNSQGQLSFGKKPFSVSTLAYITSTARAFLIDSGGVGTKQEWYLYYRDQRIWFYMESTGSGDGRMYIQSKLLYPINTQMHITCTCDGSLSVNGLNLYVDGVLQDVDRLTPSGNVVYNGMVNRGGNIYIGAYSKGTGFKTTGRLESIKFWDVELPDDFVLDLATKELAGTETNT